MPAKAEAKRAIKRRRIGIKDIAELANLSKASVSYALNGTGRLDADTRARVLEIARVHGYRANLHARSLKGKGFGVLAVFASLPTSMSEVISNTDYFIRLWQGAVTSALERGYMLLLAPFGTGPELLGSMPIDGGIVVDPIRDDPILARLDAQGLPAVIVGQATGRSPDRHFCVDNPHAALATDMFRLFRDKGAKRIGILLASQQYAYAVDVKNAYLDWIAATGQEAVIIEIEEAPLISAGYAAAQQMLAAASRPDAIYASLDRLAAGVFFAAESARIQVPDELMIAAGSDGSVTRTAPVPITALDLHPDLLGREAVSILIEQIEGEPELRRQMIPGHTEFRASTNRAT